MSIDLGRRLIAAGLVPTEEVEAALFLSVARGVPFARVLIDRGAITERGLEVELERLGGLGLRQVGGAPELVARLPRAMCRRLAALPTRLDPHTGTIDVAAADPLDPHVAAEFGFHLGAPIRVVRAPIAAIEEAIRRLELDEPEAAAPIRARERRKTPPFPHGAPTSSVPPPVLDEAPIPLVRKAAGRPAETLPAPMPVIPQPVAVPAPAGTPSPYRYNDSAPSPHRATLRPPGISDAPSVEPPAVSFPSLPPEGSGDRLTPTYGTPALAPPAEPIELGPRARAARAAEIDGEDAAADHEPEGHAIHDASTARVVRMPDLAPVLDALERAGSRDAVIREAMRGMRAVARRIGIFVVKKDGFHGWACNVELGDPDAFREVVIPAEQPSVLATATATAMYLGRIPATPAHEALLRVLESASADVAAVTARVAGRPVLVLLADELDDTLTGTRYLGDLAGAVGDALARLLSQR